MTIANDERGDPPVFAPITLALNRASPGDLMKKQSGTIPQEEYREYITALAEKFQEDLEKASPGSKLLQFTMSATFHALVAEPL